MPQFKDITGERFGRLVAIRPVHTGIKVQWLCACDCGGEAITTSTKLKSGHTKSCGCYQRQQTSLASLKDLSGQKFGLLKVIERVCEPSAEVMYKCECECGRAVVVRGGNLRSGGTRSCGCLRREMVKEKNTKHNGCGTRLYRTWRNMLDRCTNPKNKEFSRYGGRGIQVCAEWKEFSKFKEWAENSGYNDILTIDRIDNDKGYSPDNCQFLTREDNSRKIKADREKKAAEN